MTNAQTLTIALANVSDTSGNTSRAIAVRMGSCTVTLPPTEPSTRATSDRPRPPPAPPASVSNFRSDVTANGVINSGDIGLTKAQSGTALPNE